MLSPRQQCKALQRHLLSIMSTGSDKYCRFQGCGWPATHGRYCHRHATKKARQAFENSAEEARSYVLEQSQNTPGRTNMEIDAKEQHEASRICPKCEAKCHRSANRCWRCGQRLDGFIIEKLINSIKWLRRRGSSVTALERAAKLGLRDDVQRLLDGCDDPRIIRRAIKLADQGKWHAVSGDLHVALSKLASVDRPTRQRQDTKPQPSVFDITNPCPECGAPSTQHMRERGLDFTLEHAFALFNCRNCSIPVRIRLDSITKSAGVKVACFKCHGVSTVPPSVWCKTCCVGLSTGWQRLIE
jgi:transcription elongation factor Elf1